jgi:hypothetical protein
MTKKLLKVKKLFRVPLGKTPTLWTDRNTVELMQLYNTLKKDEMHHSIINIFNSTSIVLE